MIDDKEVERFENIFPLIKRIVGWSADTFGKKIGVSRQTINNLEKKKYKLPKPTYVAMRYVLDEEIDIHKDKLDMLKVILDAFVDYPNKYSDEEKKIIYSKANILSYAIKPNGEIANRTEISNEWKAIVTALGVITLTTIAGIFIGAWKNK